MLILPDGTGMTVARVMTVGAYTPHPWVVLGSTPVRGVSAVRQPQPTPQPETHNRKPTTGNPQPETHPANRPDCSNSRLQPARSLLTSPMAIADFRHNLARF